MYKIYDIWTGAPIYRAKPISRPQASRYECTLVHNFHSLGTHLPLVIIPTGMGNPEWSSITVESIRCPDGI